MSQIVSDCPRFAFVNHLKKVALLGTGLIPALYVLGLSRSQLVWANPPEQIAQTAGQPAANVVQSENGLIEHMSGETGRASLPRPPVALPVLVPPSATTVARHSSVVPYLPPPPPSGLETARRTTSNSLVPTPDSPIVATVGAYSDLGLKILPPNSRGGCSSTTCNYTVPLVTSQVPPLEVPPTPVKTWQEQIQSQAAGSINGATTMGQLPYLPPSQTPLPPLPTPTPIQSAPNTNFTPPYPTYAPNVGALPPYPLGQQPYLPPSQTPIQSAPNTNFTPPYPTYAPNACALPPYPLGQQPYLPPSQTPIQSAPNTNFTPPYPTYVPNVGALPPNSLGQQPYLPPSQAPLPALPSQAPPPIAPPNANLTPPASTVPAPNGGTVRPTPIPPLGRTQALSSSALQLQGVYKYEGNQSSARARVAAVYPLTPRVLFGATVDLTNGNGFADSRTQGLSLNELYLATSLQDLPNLRFVIGQLDLTSYFDRNSFAKDGATHFFNQVFQTNPALVTTGLNSRPGLLVNWSLTDNIEAKAAVFSSSRAIGNFGLDGFAGEIGVRYGNAIIRGTYATDRDAGTRDGFREIFQIARLNGGTGPQRSDREESYGVNAEVFVPNLKMGLFARYGRYENHDLGAGGDTYSAGVSFLDLFTPADRLGLAYGRDLSNDRLRRQAGDKRPDVMELFYDFRFLPNVRLGLTVQERNDFSETIFGFRVKTELDVAPLNKQIR